MSLGRGGTVAASLIATLLIGLPSAVAGGGLVVADFESAPTLRAQAASLTMLVRSQLSSTNRPGVSRGALLQALAPGGGAKELLTVEDDRVAKTLAALKADRLLTATVKRRGPGLEIHLRVLDQGGIELGTATLRGHRGDIGALAVSLTRKASDLAGELVTVRRPRISVGQLRAFAAAGRALNARDRVGAARSLSAARRGVGNRVLAAREIADAVLADATMSFEQRALAAIASGSTIELAKQASAERAASPRSPVVLAAIAFLSLERGDTKAAAKQLRTVRRSKNRFVMLVQADLHHRRGDKRKRNRLLGSLLAAPPYVPALAFIADLPPGDLGVVREAKVLTAAIALKAEFPGLAAVLGARAARGGTRVDEALELVDAAELDGTELAALKPLIDSKVKANKAVGLRLSTEIHMRDGDSDAARKTLARGLALDSADERLKRYQASLKVLDGAATDETDEADKMRAATSKRLSSGSRPSKSSSLEALTDQLGEVLAAFPALASGQLSTIAIVSLPDNHEPFYMPRQVVPDQLRVGLLHALKRAPYELAVTEAAGTVSAASKADYQRIVTGRHVQAVLAYGIRTSGSKARIHLVLYSTGRGTTLSGTAREHRESLDGASLGLVRWNRMFLGILGVIGFLLVAFVAWKFLRPTGTIVVGLALDADAVEPAFAIQLSRSSKRPTISSLDDHAEKLRRTGADHSQLYCAMVGKTTRFEAIPTGRWWVHVYGTFAKAGQLRMLPDEHSKQVKLKRGQPLHVKFDLVPTTTEYRLRVYDGPRPVADAEVWLDDDRASSVRTPKTGDVVLELGRGDHVIRIAVNRMRIEKPLTVVDAKVHNVTINLERERRLARIKDGIELESDDSADVELVDSGGRAIASATHSPAAPAAIPEAAGAPLVSFGPRASEKAATAQTVATPFAVGTVAPAPAAATPQHAGGAPTGLHRYQAIQELGRGAMGVVYRAVDKVLERDVALKVMSEAVRQYPAALEMFLQEAKALAALNHPNIVTVFDQGHDNGQPFMVMEWVEGTTLEDILEQEERLPIARAVDLADQVCAGLAYAHGRRVIHRDIKPANIFVTPDGTVKIGDFGLARVMNELKIKQTEIKGTPLYMSPEQIYGKDIDFRSDLYAVGCTLFEVLAGQPPFVDGEILFHHINTPPPRLSEFRPEVPDALEALVMRCIAKDKDQRFPSADTMRKHLQSIRAMMS